MKKIRRSCIKNGDQNGDLSSCHLEVVKKIRRSCTSIKNHFHKMKRDIGMANNEKLVKQEFHIPSIEFHTPSLYLCFFIFGTEQESGFMEAT